VFYAVLLEEVGIREVEDRIKHHAYHILNSFLPPVCLQVRLAGCSTLEVSGSRLGDVGDVGGGERDEPEASHASSLKAAGPSAAGRLAAETAAEAEASIASGPLAASRAAAEAEAERAEAKRTEAERAEAESAGLLRRACQVS
jgi:hypothetical protein